MKKLFILALLPLVVEAAPVKKSETKPAPVEVAPPVEPKPRKPGFWERAWGSAKKTGSGVGRVVTRPFRGGSKEQQATKNWRDLALTLSFEPAQVKLPETKAVKVIFAVANRGEHAVQLNFPTTQRIEVLLRGDDGKVLSKWSEDQKVEQEQGFLVINPEERLEYSANVSTREMSAGQTYTIEAYFPNYEQLRTSQVLSPVK